MHRTSLRLIIRTGLLEWVFLILEVLFRISYLDESRSATLVPPLCFVVVTKIVGKAFVSSTNVCCIRLLVVVLSMELCDYTVDDALTQHTRLLHVWQHCKF